MNMDGFLNEAEKKVLEAIKRHGVPVGCEELARVVYPREAKMRLRPSGVHGHTTRGGSAVRRILGALVKCGQVVRVDRTTYRARGARAR